VILWYLHLHANGKHSVVAAYPEWEDGAAESFDEAITPVGFVRCAEGFEEFLFRFWLENTLWFAEHEGRPLTPMQRAYVEELRRRT
jgi:hypothetical protein